MVRPVLEYASAVWDPPLQIDINKLERVQRRAARYATNTYMEQAPGTVTTLLQDLRWDTLENRRSSTRLQMLYKINNKLVDLNKSHFYRQADGVAARGSRTVGFLRRNFSSCSTPVKAATYTTMVRPVLEYASAVWDPPLQIDINKLERVQRRAARYATNTYMEQAPGTVTTLLQDLRWDTLENRRSSTRLQMLYKINNKLVDLNKSHFYRQADGRTRGNRIYQERVNYPAHFNSFPRTLRQWNTLPPSATSAPSLETFRARIGCSPNGLRPTSASP
ncbi:hypothetical protein ACOMHN_044534 [Nucella lapillus]